MGKKLAAAAAPRSEAQRLWAQRHPRRAAEERGFRKARAELIDRWSHKNEGTPETHAAHSRRREGAIARLHLSGHIDDNELAWSREIRETAERIAAEASVRTASLETRVDTSRHGNAFFEALGAVWSEMAYSRWRARLGAGAGVVLDIVVRDIGLAAAAGLHGMHVRRAKRLLSVALQLWPVIHSDVRQEVGPEELVAAHAQLLA